MRPFWFFAIGVGLLSSLGTAASSQTVECEPGVRTLIGASDVVVRAVPVSMKREEAGGMIYARGEYRVVDQARGDVGSTVTVEFSCIDMKSPSGKDDIGHCPDGEGVVLPGFERVDDRFQASKVRLPLFLSREETSPLDSETVRGDVTFRPFTSCSDSPRDFETPEDEWAYVKKVESEERPSSPVKEITEKAKENEKRRKKSGCG